ncbi:MAG: long-chain-fatty-acid--CoA ligase [Gaiellaceae bacterium]
MSHAAPQRARDRSTTQRNRTAVSAASPEGLRPGQTVAVQLPNVPQFLFAYFGILKAGLVMVPLNPLLRAPEVAYHLSDSDTALLITFDAYSTEATEAARQVGGIPVYMVSSGASTLPEGIRSFDELYRSPDSTEIAATSADDTAVLLYTSGTTGRPKGAELTHFQMYMACAVGGEAFGYRPEDVSLTVLPLFHVFGLSSTLNVAIRYGGSVVLLPRFEAAAALEALERRRCTVICGVPTMYIALLHADVAGRDLSALRVGVSGGASIPGEVIRGFEEKFPGVVILEGYGLSETVALATFNRSAEDRRVLSIGKPMWGVDIRIVDEEDRELPPGPEHVGELVMRGHNVMKGYYKNPEATAEALRGGWFRTGDLAYRDSDGFLFIVDRKKDLVIRGGFNVYPREIEEVLHQHPDVTEAAVVGRPDERLGEEVVAYVTVRAGASTDPAELIEFCKQRLAAYKYPRAVHLLDELPRNATGKVLKTELRTW